MTEQGQSGSGWNQPTAGWPPAGQPQYADQDGRYEGQYQQPPPAAAPTMLPRRGRPGLIVLISVLVEIALVAAVANQGLTRHVGSFASKNQDNFVGQAALASLTYSWRLAPADNETTRMWLSQTLGVVSVFVFTGLLMLTVLRGHITFARAWFGTWMAVIVATGLGGVVVNAIYADPSQVEGVDRVTFAIFATTNSHEFAASLGLGLVVGLVAGLIAVISRRPAEAVAPTPVLAPPSGDGFFDPSQQPRPFAAPAPRSDRDTPSLRKDRSPDQTTAELPVAGDAQQTTQLPRFGIADSSPSPSSTSATSGIGAGRETDTAPATDGGSTGGSQPDSRQTTQLPRVAESDGEPRRFPRPPDDEDLGHQPE